MALGVSPISNDLNRSAMQFQASMLEQLGQQVRQDLRVVQTNRQLGQFSQQIQTVDPAAPDFTQKVTGLMSQYPLAATSPIGSAAINQLGAQRKFIQQQQLAALDPWRSAGQGVFYNQSTGETKVDPALRPVERPVQVGRGTVALQNPRTGEVTPVSEFGLEMPTMADPFELEQVRQEGREKLATMRGSVPPQIKAQIDTTGKNLTNATDLFMKKDSEATALESRWNTMKGDTKERQQLGIEATAARNQALRYKQQVDELSNQLKTVAGSVSALNQLGAQAAQPQVTGLPVQSSAPIDEVALIGSDVIPSVRNAAEAQRLPKGTKFRDPFGNIRIVP